MKTRLFSLLAVTLLLVTPALVLAQTTGQSADLYGRLHGHGPVPAISSCGTASAIVGTDTAGKVTIGTGTPSACTITFARAYANAPSCHANSSDNADNPIKAVSTTTAVVLTLTAAAAENDVVSYLCVGR